MRTARLPAPITWLLLAAAAPLPPLGAQSAADRAAVLAFSDTLARATRVEEIRALEGAKLPGTTGLIRAALAALRRGELGEDRAPYDQALQLIERAIDAEKEWPLAWYGLGLVHIASYRRAYVVKASNYTPAGMSYREAAMRSFIRAIEQDSTFLPPADALAGIVLSLGHRVLPKIVVEPLRRVSLVPGSSPAISLAAANVAYFNRRYPEVLDLLGDYRRRGGDAGVAQLEQARALMALGRPDEAVATYLAGLDGLSRIGSLGYRDDLSWIASVEELRTFDSLPHADLPQFIRRFWRERDVLNLRLPNERLAEHLRRWVYVHEEFLTQRPDDVPAAAEGFGPQDQGSLFEVGAVAQVLTESTGGTPTFRAYRRTQWEIDDRGVMYLRHGAPTKKVSSVAGPPNESWAYDLPEGRRVFHFIASRALGTTAPTTLTATLPLDADMLEARAELDGRYAQLANRIQRMEMQARSQGQLTALVTSQLALEAGDGGITQHDAMRAAERSQQSALQLSTPSLPPELLWREAARARTAIAAAVSSDGYPPRFESSLDAIVQLHGVGFGAGEAKRILVVFAVPGARLVPKPRPDGGPGVLYPIAFRVIAIDRVTGLVRQLDTTRTFLAQDTLRGEQHLTGLLELPVPAGIYRVRALVTQPGSVSGTGIGRDSVALPGSPREMVLSDLILGRAAGGITWRYGGDEITLNPLNAFPRGADAELTYEVGGLIQEQSYAVLTTVRKSDDKPDAKPLVQVGFEFAAAQPYELVRRGLGLANLKPGNYLLTVIVREAGSTREVRRTRALNILVK